MSDPAQIVTELKALAREEGFMSVGIAKVPDDWDAGAHLHEFIAQGRHGDMDWMPARANERAHPRALWDGARSMIALTASYAPDHDPMDNLAAKTLGNISVYARGRDYHVGVKKRLKRIGRWLGEATGEALKVFVDTAPLMEKPVAQQTGIGWQGKHTNLLSRQGGNWFFLGVILSAAQLPSDREEGGNCGTCTSCLDICPTKAFPAPYQLDARRCISYLTIEHKGHIDREFRAAMGNRIFGCDDCLAICPWNKFARTPQMDDLLPRTENVLPELAELASLSNEQFRNRFTASPVKRTGRARFLRNVMIAIGNSGSRELIPVAENALAEDEPLIRAMAVWALSRLQAQPDFNRLRDVHLPNETDQQVRIEWQGVD